MGSPSDRVLTNATKKRACKGQDLMVNYCVDQADARFVPRLRSSPCGVLVQRLCTEGAPPFIPGSGKSFYPQPVGPTEV